MSFEKPKRKEDKKILEIIRKKPCESCGKISTKENPNQAAHIKSRGAFGDDVENNLLSLCFKCHHDQHLLGWKKFLEDKPMLRIILAQKGWRIGDNNKLVFMEYRCKNYL